MHFFTTMKEIPESLQQALGTHNESSFLPQGSPHLRKVQTLGQASLAAWELRLSLGQQAARRPQGPPDEETITWICVDPGRERVLYMCVLYSVNVVLMTTLMSRGHYMQFRAGGPMM